MSDELQLVSESDSNRIDVSIVDQAETLINSMVLILDVVLGEDSH